MEKFLEKWKTNKRFKTTIKLSLYTSFVILVAIFATTGAEQKPLNSLEPSVDNNEEADTIIIIPEKYSYEIDIEINDKNYRYTGIKDEQEETISKEKDNVITNYKYQQGKYYIEENGTYILTTKENVYDIVNYNYINLESIKEYLNTSKKDGNQYQIFLKDVILGNTSDSYFIINVLDSKINIDYKPLMQELNQEIYKYNVIIKYEEIK